MFNKYIHIVAFGVVYFIFIILSYNHKSFILFKTGMIFWSVLKNRKVLSPKLVKTGPSFVTVNRYSK